MYNLKSWSTQKAAPKQLNAINTYNKCYGIVLQISNKQNAHDVIKTFVPKQILEFEKGFVKGTNVRFEVVDRKLFSKWQNYNKSFKKVVKEVKISEDGKTAYLGIKLPSITPTQTKQLNNVMFDMLENPSFSREEDALGYLSPQELEQEGDLYGVDPILSGIL